MTEYYIVEAVTEQGVRLETPEEEMILVEPARFSALPQPGDCLLQTEEGLFVLDEEATAARRERLARRTKALFHRKGGA